MKAALKWLDSKGRKIFLALIVLQAVLIVYAFSDGFSGNNLAEVVKWIMIATVGGNIGEHFANRGQQL